MMTVTPDASKPLSGLLVLRLRTTMLTVRRVDTVQQSHLTTKIQSMLPDTFDGKKPNRSINPDEVF